MPKQHIFISYTTNDGSEFAQKLYDGLKAHQFEVWFDRYSIKPGADFYAEIESGTRNAMGMVVVLTPGSVRSFQVKSEWNNAFSQDIPILPVLAKTCEVPALLSLFNWIDFRDDFDTALKTLVDRLTNLDVDHLADLERRLESYESGHEGIVPEYQFQIARLRKAIDRWREQKRASNENYKPESVNLADRIEEEKQSILAEVSPRGDQAIRIVGTRLANTASFFLNREHEQQLLRKLLADEVTHLISIIGQGGIGKTWLVSNILAELEQNDVHNRTDGQTVSGIAYLSSNTNGINFERIFLGCAEMLDGEQGQALRDYWLYGKTAIEAKIDRLLSALQDDLFIILLDNFEDLQESTGNIIDHEIKLFLEAVVQSSSSLKLVLTTRIPVQLPYSLSIYDYKVLVREGLSIEHGIEFLRRADVDSYVGLRGESGEKLAAAVKMVNGLPRALQVIYNILVSDPFTSLDDMLEIQSFVQRDDVVQILVDGRYRHLDDESRVILSLLSVFRRPVSNTAIEYVLNEIGHSLDLKTTLKKLASTFAVQLTRNDKDEQLISIDSIEQEFIYSRIPADASNRGRENLERTVSRYYEAIAPPLNECQSKQHLEPQIYQFSHLVRSGDGESASYLLEEIEPYLRRWGFVKELVDMHQSLRSTLANPVAQSINLGRLGRCYQRLGRYEEAIEVYRQAIQIAENHNAQNLLGEWLEGLGDVHQSKGEYETAVEYYTRSLDITRSEDNDVREGHLLANLGRAYRDLGDLRQAIEYLEEAIQIAEETRDLSELGNRLGSLGSVFTSVGQFDRALDVYSRALNIAEGLDDQRWMAVHTGRIGDLRRMQGRYEQSIEMNRKALDIVQRIGAKNVEGFIYENIGLTYRALRLYDRALDALEQSLTIAIELQNIGHKIRRSMHIAQIRLTNGFYNEVLEIAYPSIDSIPLTTVAHLNLLRIIALAALDRTTEAVALLDQTTALLRVPRTPQDHYLLSLILSCDVLLNRSEDGRQQSLGSCQEVLGNAVQSFPYDGLIEDTLQLYETLNTHEKFYRLKDCLLLLHQIVTDHSLSDATRLERTAIEYIGDASVFDEVSISHAIEKLARISRLRVKQRLTSGHSGDQVFLVDVDPSTNSDIAGPHYLKIQSNSSNSEAVMVYSHLQDTVMHQYMPQLIDHAAHESYLAMLYRPAQNSIHRQQVTSLGSTILSDLPYSVRQVGEVCDIIIRWNQDYQTTLFTPYELIIGTLGERRVVGKHSVQHRVKRSLDIEDHSALLLFGGRLLLPNPLTYLSNKNLWEAANIPRIVSPMGHTHGDLHTDNIICSIAHMNEVHEPEIIDFATYKNDSLIFFDWAYLEFDIITRLFDLENRAHRKEILSFIPLITKTINISTISPTEPISQALTSLITPIRNGVKAIFGQRVDDYSMAYWIACYAVGMNYARKRLKVKAKWLNLLGLIFAASALRNILDYFDISYEGEIVPSVMWIDRQWH
jgi:tetratricopeptide (TPR) repeat protein